MKQWYAIHTKPRQETAAEENLRRQYFKTYLPRIKQVRRYRGQWRDKIEPLFPRYLFIRLSLGEDNIAPIRSTLGVSKLVSFGESPTVVPAHLIEALTQSAAADTGLHHPEKSLFKTGDLVTILEGPLEGLKAIFKVHDGEQRSIILLNMLGKNHDIKIDKAHIWPAQYS